jgi:glycosyltransferase involved in cell wall biosynthesis
VSSPPSVAVIVPVRDRRDLLRELLDALDRQEHRDFEVVVVDDGSTDGSDAEAVARPVAGRPVALVRSGGQGAVAARRLGVASTGAEVLAFTDSDCAPAPGWLAAAMRHVERGAELVHGRTLPARRMLPLERSVTEVDFGLFPTCNLVVTRAAYDAVGGFDPAAGSRWRFRPSERARGLGFGEDTLFGWSIARHMPAVYEADMLVHHHVFPPDLADWVSRSWLMGAFPALVREVPELRRTLVRNRVQWGRRSRVPVYATALATLTRRPLLVGLAAGWWVLHRYRWSVRGSGLPLPAQLRLLPPQLLLDVIQAAALLAGSARARTLLL